MKNNWLKVIVVVFLLISITLFGTITYKSYKRKYNKFYGIDLKGINKIMIVAHPDDEMIWGGSRLIKDDYFVVCITCGVNKERVKEFKHVMQETNDKYIMLGYPDKTLGKKNNWNLVYKDIENDIKKILELKNWQEIVTHNPDGEYGHIHHKKISKIVTDNTKNKAVLIYFSKYYSKNTIDEVEKDLPSMDDEMLQKKVEILKIYKSQDFIFKMFKQMFKHENLISYNDWIK